MKHCAFVFVGLFCLGTSLHAAQRFGRSIVSLDNSNDYQYVKLDGVKFPTLSSSKFTVSCLVYRGTENYYVEVGIQNNSSSAVTLPPELLEFTKPGYTVFRTNTSAVAAQLASSSGQRFIPTPPPQMPASSTTTTNINANATTYGNMTQINGTATSTTIDTSGQAGANFGNALANAFAAGQFYRAQRDDMSLAQYLNTFAWADAPVSLEPGKARIVMMTFGQVKHKKAPFQIVVHVGEEHFTFKYKE